ncbi:MAG: chemotaxis response regulator protein-glutamate methylesterase [Candidatus Kapaibacterium sp.]|nr:MAG: chemotaxis response regulator protein-glutamate methylesterase [Candidatus Kapabacteria bacterium]
MNTQRIRVLIVDDSPIVRELLERGLAVDPALEVVGTAADALEARDKIVTLRPHVLTLDVEMPRINGVEFLRRLMPQYPIPVVMVSSLTHAGQQITLQALEYGAVDFIAKPNANAAGGMQGMIAELRNKIKIAARANVAHWKGKKSDDNTPKVVVKSDLLAKIKDTIIAIGASTGGPEALRKIVEYLPASTPGMIIAQHMPPNFITGLAERLNQVSPMTVKTAETGDIVKNGTILLAPGDRNVRVIRKHGQYEILCDEGGKINGHCPSIDILMSSVAEVAGNDGIGVILTGVGDDGAIGLKTLMNAGGTTIVQNEATSTVASMPRRAVEIGAALHVLPIESIAEAIVKAALERVPEYA